MDKKIEETREFLQTIGMPKAQLADICCYVILAMAGIKPDMSWSEATNEWIRIHDVWCKSVNIAKRTIESAEEPILLIDCDHDLGDYAYDGGDGIKLLDWLAENERFYPIKLHTMNPVGRENMLRMIRRYW